jgi:translocation and assembly module TamB
VGLDLQINAPGRIFLRGRGIDAEFGGAIRIAGTPPP